MFRGKGVAITHFGDIAKRDKREMRNRYAPFSTCSAPDPVLPLLHCAPVAIISAAGEHQKFSLYCNEDISIFA